jgi:class 3 adenylate cyclase
MADSTILRPLTGHPPFDRLIAEFSDITDAAEQETARARIWDEFGTEGAVFISYMTSFSSTARKIGVCHFLKLIHRARQTIAPIITANNGTLLKCEADNCYAFFERPDDAIRASFDVNSALFESNERYPISEQIYLSVGIDYGRVLLIDHADYFGDPVNTASKLGEDLAIKAETLVTERAIEHSDYVIPERADRMKARISEIEIRYVRIPMTESSQD